MPDDTGSGAPTSGDVVNATQLNELYEKSTESAAAMEKYQKAIEKLSLSQAENLKKQVGIEKAVVGLLEKQIKQQEKLKEGTKDTTEQAEKYLNILRESGKFLGQEGLIHEAKTQHLKAHLAEAEKNLRVLKSAEVLNAEAIKGAQDEANVAKKKYETQVRIAGARTKAQQELAATAGPLVKGLHDIADSGRDAWFGNMDMMYRFTNDFANHMKGMASKITGGLDIFSLDGVIQEFFKLGLELDTVATNFARTTRLGEKFNDVLDSTIESSMKLGASMADAAEANKALITTVTDFTFASETQATRLANTTTLMTRFGISSQTTAENMQASMKIFSQSFEGADATMYELIDTAEALKVLPEELAGQFGKMSGSLAKLGSEGVDAFKELARVAKITGMEMEKIVQITDKFDTFEGAAEQVGKINAALGGNFVNAMDLMMDTDPASRFETIRDAIKSTGLTFDSMSYYQRKFFAESLGMADVGDLALMMSGNMNSLGDATNMTSADYEKLAQEAATMQSVQDKFNTTMAEFFMENKDEVMDFIDKIRSLLEYVMEHIDLWSLWIETALRLKLAMIAISGIMGGLKIALIASAGATWAKVPADIAATISTNGLGMAMLGLKLRSFGAAMAIGAFVLVIIALAAAFMMASPSKLVMAVFALGAAVFLLGRMSEASVVSIQALAIPMLQLGVAVGIAAAGLGLMAWGFSLLDGSEMLLVAIAIISIATALYYLIPGLTGIGSVSVAVSPGLAIFAAVIISIGASIAIAAAGIGYMASSLATMFDSINAEKITLFGAFVASLVGAAPVMWAAAGGLFELGFGMAAFGLGLSFASEDKLRSIADFATGLAGLEVGALEALGAALEKVAEAMEKIPDSKAIALTATMKSAAVAAAAVEALGGGGGAGGRGAGGARGTKRSTERTRPFEVKFILDGEVFERKVIKIYESEDGKYHAEAARNER